MVKILFVCHGNICRSPMAEFMLKDIINKKGLQNNFDIASCATSCEEIGNDIHYGTRDKLTKMKVPFSKRSAIRITKEDYNNYDYILCMDKNNLRNLERVIGKDTNNKVFRLLDFSPNPRDISDPWYTGNFDDTYNDILEGINCFLENIL